jgi:hypothetical protein
VQNTLAGWRKKALQHKSKNGDINEETLIMSVVLKSQLAQERIADATSDLYASACTLSRLDRLLVDHNSNAPEVEQQLQAGRYFLALSSRRIKNNLAALDDNDDDLTVKAARAWID